MGKTENTTSNDLKKKAKIDTHIKSTENKTAETICIRTFN